MSQSLESFTEAYVNILVNYWSDAGYADRLKSAPGEVARAAGLEIPENVVVTTVPADARVPGDVAAYHRDFAAGIAEGKVEIVLPEAPAVDSETIEEEDLASVSGGARACCCCPCSCCTEW